MRSKSPGPASGQLPEPLLPLQAEAPARGPSTMRPPTRTEIIEKVTVAPAENFQLRKKGKIEEGFDADFTIFEWRDQKKTVTDSNGNQRMITEQIRPVYTIIGGKKYECE